MKITEKIQKSEKENNKRLHINPRSGYYLMPSKLFLIPIST